MAPFEAATLSYRRTDHQLPVVPQPWRLTASSPSLMRWKHAVGAAHSGRAGLQLVDSGAAAVTSPQSATVTIPAVEPSSSSVLRFALRVPKLSDSSCASDVLTVRVDGKKALTWCKSTNGWTDQEVDLSPWAGKVVDIALEVTRSADPSAGSLWEIDDVAITGKCKYACFLDHFDQGGSEKWLVEKKFKKMTMTWSVAKGGGADKSNAAFFSHDATEKGDSTAGFLANPGNAAFRVPVTGVMYHFSAKVEIAQPKCPTNNVFEFVYFPWPFKAKINWDDASLLHGFCQSTKGWEKYTSDMPPPVYGRWVGPAMLAHKGLKNPSMKVWIDDIVFICQ